MARSVVIFQWILAALGSSCHHILQPSGNHWHALSLPTGRKHTNVVLVEQKCFEVDHTRTQK
jgi:hypothetical protein